MAYGVALNQLLDCVLGYSSIDCGNKQRCPLSHDYVSAPDAFMKQRNKTLTPITPTALTSIDSCCGVRGHLSRCKASRVSIRKERDMPRIIGHRTPTFEHYNHVTNPSPEFAPKFLSHWQTMIDSSRRIFCLEEQRLSTFSLRNGLPGARRMMQPSGSRKDMDPSLRMFLPDLAAFSRRPICLIKPCPSTSFFD